MPLEGTVNQVVIVLDQPGTLPDGTRVRIEPLAALATLGLREEDWPTDPEGIAQLLERMDRMEPLEITAEEEADLAAWRQKIKEYTVAKMQQRVEGLFP